jgi:hypothetical protein
MLKAIRKAVASRNESVCIRVALQAANGTGNLARELASRHSKEHRPAALSRRLADIASVRLWLADGFPLADVLTMLEVHHRLELSPGDVARAYAVEILSAARAEIHLANQPVIAHQKEIQNAAA